MNMLGIAAKPGVAEPQLVEVLPLDSPDADQVLCRTIHLGVCGTDREILHSQAPWKPPGEEHLILGHECLAEVVEMGSEVQGLEVGDYVVPIVRRANDPGVARPDLLPLGEYTERGIAFAHGFSTPYWIDPPQHLFKVPRELRDVAVLTEPISISEKGINEAIVIQEARLGAGCWSENSPRVLVTGMGPIGFGAVIAAVCRQWSVTMMGRDPIDSFRAIFASELGATYCHTESIGNRSFDLAADGFDLILECTGSEHLMLQVAPLLKSCGVMAWLGSNRLPRQTQLDVASLMRTGLLRNHLFLGTVNAASRDFRDALRHIQLMQRQRPELLKKMLTDFVSVDESIWHYQHRKPQGIKTVVEFPVP